jgi:hypothetical protein
MILAFSITGTLLTNVTVATLILFFPRLLISMVTQALSQNLPFIPSYVFDNITGLNLSIPYNFIAYAYKFSLTGLFSGDIEFKHLDAIIYTFIASAVLFFIGCLLYKRRHSETAEKSSPLPALQHVYRICATLPFALIVPYLIFTNKDHTSYIQNNLGLLVVIYIVAVLIYFLYELITTKKLKDLIFAALLFPNIILFQVIFSISVIAVTNIEFSIKPNTEDISSVTFVNPPTNTLSTNKALDEEENTYYDSLAENFIFTDKTIINKVLSDLKITLKFSSNANNSINTQYSNYCVKINLKSGNSIIRHLIYEPAIINGTNDINGIKILDNNYKNTIATLPTENEISNIKGIDNLTAAKNKTLWQALRAELENLSAEKRIETICADILFDLVNTAKTAKIDAGFFTITGKHGSETFITTYHITEKTPKTLALLIELQNMLNKAKS